MDTTTQVPTQKSINERFGQLVKTLIEYKRVKNLARLADLIDVHPTQFGRVVNGGTGTNATPEMLGRVLQLYPDINPGWLFGWVDDPMFLEGNAQGLGPAIAHPYVELPFVRAEMRASFTESFLADKQADVETLRVLYVPAKKFSKGVVFEVNGDSMEPYYLPGARVLATPVNPDDWKYLTSGVYAVAFGSSFVIKRVKDNEIPSQGILTLHSDNPDGGSLPVRVEDVRAIWKVEQIVYSPAR